MRRAPWVRGVLIAVLVVVVTPLALAHLMLRASLPQLDGRASVAGLAAPASIERDALGVVTVSAASRSDLAFATGYAHAQDRFFQMDLARRLAAGELAELFGPVALRQDERARLFRFRSIARTLIAAAPAEHRGLIEAYTRGVNRALAGLAGRPWEYWLLGAAPQRWRAEDTILVAYAMWWDLQYGDFRTARMRRELDARLGGERCAGGWKCALAFLYPQRTQWDSPNVADEAALAAADARAAMLGPVPDAAALDLRAPRVGAAPSSGVQPALAELLWRATGLAAEEAGGTALGSNAFAVAGRLSANGAAVVASDMHLGLRVPTTWYRMRLRLAGGALDLNGLTLPGAPLLIAGSNGHVAWAFTNSYGEWLDLKPLECASVSDARLESAAGPLPLATVTETIRVHGAASVALPVRSIRDGAMAGAVLFEVEPGAHRCWLARWLAQLPAASNLNLQHLEQALSAAQVLALAPGLGMPHQNIIVGDSAGHIGWTIAGRVPLDTTGDARLTAAAGWRGADTQPHIYDPPLGRLWTANARATDEEAGLVAIGGDAAPLGAYYDLGARARQIRDDLLALKGGVQPSDLLRIQLDDRALFLERWRDELLGLIDRSALEAEPARAEFRRLIEGWDARAAADSCGYYLVRAFRTRLRDDVWQQLLRTLGVAADAPPPMQFEEPLWRMLSREPPQLLPAPYASWRAFLLAELDATIADLKTRCTQLARCRWGAHNPVRVRHPLSAALPLLAPLIDMPGLALPGDHDMPRVQDGAVGASERFGVAPGHEAQGYLHIAGGQSGHPLSPYYRAGFAAWAQGEPLPFLPGRSEHRLELRPSLGQPVH